jgi:hypothetical protein
MGVPAYALSASHFVSSVGADAGFAALIGLAVLVLLYFAQARETASLRDRFAEASDQVHRLEQRIAQLSRNTAAPAAAPAPASLQRQGVAPAAALATSRVASAGAQAPPAAPAFTGAPALAAATRFTPGGQKPIAIHARDEAAQPAARAQTPAPERVPVGAGVAAGETVAAQASGGSGGGFSAPPAPRPATAAGGATAGGAAAGGAGARTGNGSGAGRPPGAQPKPYKIAGARTPGAAAPQRQFIVEEPERSRRRGALLIAAGVLVIVAVVAVLLVLTNNGSSSSQASSSAAISNAPGATQHRKSTALTPASVTVAVLNGTSTTNLAHDVFQTLGGHGFKRGTIATATDQTQTATVIGYLPGQRRAALLVARALNLGSASVQPVDQSNQAVACPQTGTCPAQVVVTVGSDLSSAAASTSSTPAG